MCNIWRSEPTEDPTLEQIKRIFDENSDLLSGLRFIQLTGGEPFLRDDLPEIAEIVHDAAPNCTIWCPTNGLLPEKIVDTVTEIISSIGGERLGITVSLDGEGKIHDIQRGIDGSYKKAMETLRNLNALKKKNRFLLSTGLTLTKDNYNQATMIQKISYQNGADFSFRPINISEHYYQNMGKSGELTAEVLPQLDAIAYTIKKEKGALRSLTQLAYVKGAKEFISGRRTLSCSAGDDSVFIDTLGDVYPCIVMNHKLGNVYEHPLRDILKSPSSWKAREIIEKLECPTCWLECEVYRDIRKDGARLVDALIWSITPFS